MPELETNTHNDDLARKAGNTLFLTEAPEPKTGHHKAQSHFGKRASQIKPKNIEATLSHERVNSVTFMQPPGSVNQSTDELKSYRLVNNRHRLRQLTDHRLKCLLEKQTK